MNRFFILLCVAGGIFMASGGGVQAASRPNIVYILADDLGYGDVSALNPESRIKTPHFDRLKAGKTLSHTFPEGFSAYWVWATSDTATTATVQFTYNGEPTK